jgi:hypothetical protein
MPRLTLLEGLADTQDGNQPGFLGDQELRRDCRVALSIQSTPLRMADDDVTAAHVTQHGASHLTRISAAAGPIREVLRAKHDPAALQPLTDRGQVNVRRAEQQIRGRALAAPRTQSRNELPAVAERAVHLPITGNQ